jgi:hypothetical protein
VLKTTVGQMYERPKRAADQGVRRRAKVDGMGTFNRFCLARSALSELDISSTRFP